MISLLFSIFHRCSLLVKKRKIHYNMQAEILRSFLMYRQLFSGLVFSMILCSKLTAHCQMPCGIYHDDMVYDQIDQFVETVYKGISVMNGNKFSSTKDKNEFVRWVIQKENCC